jgi:RNA polymerase sigma factor (sigma-70 family)
MSVASEGTLVAAAPARPDFEVLYPDLHRLAYQAAFRLLGQRHAAEEIAQEAAARAFVRWPRVADHAVPWVVRVATNLGIDEVRRRRRLGTADAAEAVTADPQLERRHDLATALARLSRRQREVMALRYLADMDDATVATTLGISAGAVKQHAARGLAALRRDPTTDVR